MRRYRYGRNVRIYYLSIFLKDEEPVTETCYSIKEVIRNLEEWEREPDFESAHLSIEE